ncbi:hypothetical protein K458DRAFT_485104 [Lentithecium fluviatile CBS 122367]|uniref:DUF3176 domain containing protein n=1 Tax=Lentithecium fluviatile CBS 122367 TaxID=1168545 RepID=A0A6G1JBM6_9PLEO|nr:hypothetical protein K458DRAFT_485104 [Lentithecium fluviatile CBS 122367]
MSTTTHPNMQDMKGGSRPWCIGSQLLGHYDLDPTHTSTNQASNASALHPHTYAAIDIHSNITRSTSHSNGFPPYPDSSRPSTIKAVSTRTESEGQEIRPLLRASTSFYERIITDWWWWELLSCLVSISCSAAIVGVLLYYDGKKQPKYVVPGITLNAYIAVFAAVAKAALILPVSETIGQLKWVWFRKGASLWDFYTFDGASRGPWGALMLLCRTKCRHLVSLGAAITVLALAFEPFFQQIASFPSRDIKSDIGTVSIAKQYFPDSDRQYRPRTNKLTWFGSGKSMSIAVSDAVFSREEFAKPPPSVCPSGRCDWKSYSTLGVCHWCEELSDVLIYACGERTLRGATGGNIKNPCGYRMNNTHFLGTHDYKQKQTTGLTTVIVHDTVKQAGTEVWNSTYFPYASNAILDFYVAFIPGNETQIRNFTSPKLLECLFHWCVKAIESSYRNGSLQEKIVNTYAEPSTTPGYQVRNASASGPFNFSLGGDLFEIGENTTEILAQALIEVLPTTLGNSETGNTGLYPGMWSIVQSAPYDIDPLFNKLATAMTNNIRSLEEGTEEVEGIAWTTQTFVEARWVWVMLPAILTLGTFLLICATIIANHSAKAPTWKSSALATLLHGITEDTRHRFSVAKSMSEIEAMSQSLRVKLSMERGSGRLVQV